MEGANDLNETLLKKFGVSLYCLLHHLWHFGLIPGSRTKSLVPKDVRRMIGRLNGRIHNERFSRRARIKYFKTRLQVLIRKVPVIATLVACYKEPLLLEDTEQICKMLQRFAERARSPLGERQFLYSLLATWAGFFQPLEDRTNFEMVRLLIRFFYKKTGMSLFSIKASSKYLKKLRYRLKVKSFLPSSWNDDNRIVVETWKKSFFKKGDVVPIFIFRDGRLIVKNRVFEDENQPAIIFSDGEVIRIGQSGRLALDKLNKDSLHKFSACRLS